MSYQYLTCCVASTSTAEVINEMVDAAIDVTYRTMLKHCPGLIDWAEGVGYERHGNTGMSLKQEPFVSYHRSKYRGRRCYYVRWSAIEYIFVQNG